jgi:hypothetical protein
VVKNKAQVIGKAAIAEKIQLLRLARSDVTTFLVLLDKAAYVPSNTVIKVGALLARVKINAQIVNTRQFPDSDLYRRFTRAFQVLLQMENPAIARRQPNDWYVPCPDYEKELLDLCASPIDHMEFLVGNTGIGKSSILRHVFAGTDNVEINGDRLVIPFYCNNRNVFSAQDNSSAIAGQMGAAIEKIKGHFNIAVDEAALVTFIAEHKAELLFQLAMRDSPSAAEQLEALRQAKPFSYLSERIKYLAQVSPLRKIVIVVDDIETIEADPEHGKMFHDFLNQIAGLHKCFENVIDRQYVVTTIIACRPITESLIRRAEWQSAYGFNSTVRLSQSIPLDDLFEARFKSALKILQEEDYGGTPSFERAKEVLASICEAISDHHGKTLSALHNYNVRACLRSLHDIIRNRRWFQRNANITSAFEVSHNDYSFTEATVFRCLALGNGETYPRKSGTPIANIFYNFREARFDLALIYMLLFVRNISNGDDAEPYDRTKLHRDIGRIFHPDVPQDIFSDLLDFAISKHLLERAFRQVGGLPTEVLSIRPCVTEIWLGLERASIFVEFFRDDTFLHDEYAGQMTPTSLLQGDDLFMSILKFGKAVARQERDLITSCADRHVLDHLRNGIGDILVSRQVSKGIRQSAFKYFRGSPPGGIISEIEKLESSISKIESIFAG